MPDLENRLRISSLEKEGVYQASKWLKLSLLVDGLEMQNLLHDLGDAWIFPLTGFSNGLPISHSFFVQEYGRWIEDLKKGELPKESDFRRLFASCITEDLSDLWLQPIASRPNEYLIKISTPVIQMQTHFVHYSSLDQEFRSMSIGRDSIFWGVQFSFPQVAQNAKTMELYEVKPNALFCRLRQWVRDHTKPTPFIVEGVRKNVPIRLGKNCFSWIESHPEIKAKGLRIYGCL
jgi:hypothetical protein